MQNVTTMLSNITYKFKQSNKWINDISDTKFNYAPRGYGRTSFRISEIIQIGRIPIYIYDDIPWIPYENTPYDLSNIGYIIKIKHIKCVLY